MTRRILITGGGGFIGSHLTDRLLAEGNDVCVIDNWTTGRPENLPKFADQIIGRMPHGGYGAGWSTRVGDAVVRVGTGDIGAAATHDQNQDGLKQILTTAPAGGEKPSIIVHCAASYDDRDKWHRDADTNVRGAVNVAIAAREWGARVIYFQTALIYGNNPYDGYTGTDEQPWPLRVDQPAAPENSYAISKYAAERYLIHSGVPLLTLRLANIYGPRNLSGPVPTFYKRITEGDPCTIVDSRRDFVYIDDLVDLVAQAVDQEATGTYHVATGRDYPIGQLYSAVCDALDRQDIGAVETTPRGDDDAPTILLDPTETQRDFGWQATTDLDEGVGRAVDWYREHGVAKTFTHLKVPEAAKG